MRWEDVALDGLDDGRGIEGRGAVDLYIYDPGRNRKTCRCGGKSRLTLDVDCTIAFFFLFFVVVVVAAAIVRHYQRREAAEAAPGSGP